MGTSAMVTIAVANQKGGVAKTTTVVNLAAEMARKNRRVLVLDFDPQRSATSSVFGNVDFELSAYELLFGAISWSSLVRPSIEFGFDVIPSDIMLSSADLRLASAIGRERVLANRLTKVKSEYDVCIIDTPPTLGLLAVNALVAADHVLIPVCPEYFSLRGIRLLEETMDSVRLNLRANLRLLGVLVTRNKKRVITNSAIRAIEDYFGDKVFETTIPENIRVEEAHSAHLPLWKYDPKCKAAVAYRRLAKEIEQCLNSQEAPGKKQERRRGQRGRG